MVDPVIAEFESPEAVIAAATRLRALGYEDLDAFTPFPVPELEDALAIRRTRLPLFVFLAAVSGTAIAYLIQWWTSAVDYRLDVGGRPFNSVPADIPIMFETTVLLAGGTAFLGALLLSGLPRLHHKVFELEGFERTTLDRFWLTVGEPVLPERLATLRAELLHLGAVAVRGGEA